MLKVNKSNSEPEFFAKFKRKEKPKNWDNFDFEIKRQLKIYMLENEQKIENEYYCPYCELELDLDESQIEHIKPKDKFPKQFSDYKNFIVGCTYEKTCGQAKGNKWDESFINPVIENPNEYFSYDIKTGKIVPLKESGAKNKKAVKTIEILNLNEDKLCILRKKYIIEIKNTIGNLADSEIADFIKNNYFRFPSLNDFLLENIETLEEMI